MRKFIVLLLLCGICLVSCGNEPLEINNNEDIQTMTQEVTETLTATTAEPTIEKGTEEPSREFSFGTEEEVQTISDEDLAYLLYHGRDYSTPYFVHDYTEIDLFGVDILKISDRSYEEIRIEYPDYSEGEKTPEIIEEELRQKTDESIVNKGKNIGNGDVICSYSDVELIFCGENEQYTEYSHRYTVTKKQYYHDELQTNEMKNAIRCVYLKNILFDRDNVQHIYCGDMTADSIKSTLDLFLHGWLLIYRNVTESENSFDYTFYYIDGVYGDYGINDTAILHKCTMSVNKETGVISNSFRGELKDSFTREYEIPDSASHWDSDEEG